MKTKIITFGRTDKGNIRKNNEDNYLIILKPDLTILCVCDGMGGHSAGEVASLLAINYLKEYFELKYKFISNLKEDKKKNLLIDILSDENLINFCNDMNKKIYEESLLNENYFGMGTTFNSVFIFNKITKILNIGDSRTYLIRKRNISQITKDHSLIQEEKDKSLLDINELEKIIPKNIITKALGIREKVEPDIYTLELENKDRIILMTDGIYDLIQDNEILEIMSSFNIKFSTNRLINLAKKRGGYDNMTLVVSYIKIL